MFAEIKFSKDLFSKISAKINKKEVFYVIINKMA